MNVITFPAPLRLSYVRAYDVRSGAGDVLAVVYWPAALERPRHQADAFSGANVSSISSTSAADPAPSGSRSAR